MAYFKVLLRHSYEGYDRRTEISYRVADNLVELRLDDSILQLFNDAFSTTSFI
jgi:hypothetical protein